MCGINGIFGLETIQNPEQRINKMNDALSHRGPDSEGVYINDSVALGHRRLSIIDTSEAGNQPFYSADKNVALIFNGELYNYLEIKADLKDFNFSTQTDTEVVMAAYLKWGVSCLSRFNGMFGLAIWDGSKKELLIARDRLGIKPIYYTESDDSFGFSSEIRALIKSGITSPELDKENLREYLRYQTVHSPRTILKDIFMIPAGHYLILSDNERSLQRYWNLAEPKSIGNTRDIKAVRNTVKSLLKSSVDLRMRADVPYGAFLSGGIDSSAIVGLMSEDRELPVSTFSVVFNERKFSEAPYAELIAKKWRTNHHELLLTPNDFLEDIPNALEALDHPSGDGPNTYMVSKKTKEAGITMALSGLGGDELFAGYDIFNRALKLENNKWLSSFAGVFRSLGGKALTTFKPSIASYKIADILNQEYIDLPHAYSVNRKILLDKEINSLLSYPEKIKNPLLTSLVELDKVTDSNGLETLTKVSMFEIESYMSNVLLRDSDQMSMAHALEVRVPFLDHRLVEYTLSLSNEMKQPVTPKKLLVDALGDLLPPEIVNRPKMGFTLPWSEWMKSELKSFCEHNLDLLAKREEFNPKELEQLWERFLAGDKLITWSRIWHLVVLGNWLENNGVQ